jgi:hypothetical protein
MNVNHIDIWLESSSLIVSAPYDCSTRGSILISNGVETLYGTWIPHDMQIVIEYQHYCNRCGSANCVICQLENEIEENNFPIYQSADLSCEIDKKLEKVLDTLSDYMQIERSHFYKECGLKTVYIYDKGHLLYDLDGDDLIIICDHIKIKTALKKCGIGYMTYNQYDDYLLVKEYDNEN